MVQTPGKLTAAGSSTAGDTDQLRREITDNIRRLQRLSNRGLWSMALFIILCIGAWNGFSFLPTLPDHIRAALGKPPPVTMISAALALYTFSAIILTLARIMSGSDKYSGFSHVAFYPDFLSSTISPTPSTKTSGQSLPLDSPSWHWRATTSGISAGKQSDGRGKPLLNWNERESFSTLDFCFRGTS